MNLKEYFHKIIITYFELVTFIIIAMMILGNVFDPDAVIHYSSLSDPLKFAAFGVIPSFVMFSSKELSVKQVIVRKLIQLLIIEGEVLFIAYGSTRMNTEDPAVIVSLAVTVLVIFLAANIMSYANDRISAEKMNQDLMNFKKNA